MSRVLGIDHIAVAVPDLDAATALWRDALGLKVGDREVVEDQGVEVQMMHAGSTRVELVAPLSADSPVAKHLERRGPGLHHLALQVEDCGEAMEQAQEAGARMVDERPRGGAHGTRIAFVHPQGTGGVLAELVEQPREEPRVAVEEEV